MEVHLISFQVPWPANYGGVIDVFYKIKTLSELGIGVHLHSFQYKRPQSDLLAKLCKSTTYYKRKKAGNPFFGKTPYIIATRSSRDLLKNLSRDSLPILFEGLHCCGLIDYPSLKDRQKVVRMHNLEHLYYKNLAKVERNPFKRYFFSMEADRLKHFYLNRLDKADNIIAISPEDEGTMAKRFNKVSYIPPFHGNTGVTALLGFGSYAMYHGNLAVGENDQAALYLALEVWQGLNYPLKIAGNGASKKLIRACLENPNITLINEGDPEKLAQLIAQAHIHVLPTFQLTGTKLKLINVLFSGRHCVVNHKMVGDSGLRKLCHIANSPYDMREHILNLIQVPFSIEEVRLREATLNDEYNNRKNGEKLVEIFSSSRLEAHFEPEQSELDTAQ